MRYLTRTDPINMYKEFRDTTLTGAVSQLYMQMSGRHRADHRSIQIVRTSVIPTSQLKRKEPTSYAKGNFKFPKVKGVSLKRAPTKSLRSLAKARRPRL